MSTRTILAFAALCLSWLHPAFAQMPETDIFIAQLTWENGKPSVGKPVNMTRKNGYDNQPCFFKEGEGFYFTGIHDDTTQSDIYRCDLSKRTVSRFTKTTVSEYSPQLSPDGKSIGIVRVDADSAQRFYTIPVDEPRMAFHHEGSDSIGYFTFLTDSSIAMFILGESNSLQLLDLTNGSRKMVCSSIGRCLKTDSRQQFLYYTDKTAEPVIKRMHVSDSAIETVASTLSGSEDFEVLKDHSLVTGASGILYRLEEGKSDWEPLADLNASVGQFYRIAVDAESRRIAFVSYSGKRP